MDAVLRRSPSSGRRKLRSGLREREQLSWETFAGELKRRREQRLTLCARLHKVASPARRNSPPSKCKAWKWNSYVIWLALNRLRHWTHFAADRQWVIESPRHTL